ncbi:hypothetical protein BGZ76_006046 [Entomortierella beljakovae]|nr:hypothetical protein BGZ76_006046 [Entomortierella beljakovae]
MARSGYLGRWKRSKLILLPLLLVLLLTIINDGTFVAAQDSGDIEEDFPETGDIDEDPLESSIPSPIASPSTTTSEVVSLIAPSPSPSPSPSLPAPPPPPPPPPAATLPTPSGILKAGTPSADCAIIADLYRATGPWQFVPDTINCCNAEYPNSSGIKCNANNQIIYIYLAGQGLSGTLPESLGSLTAHNRLSGSLPSSAGGWANLGTLNLEQNALTGSLPDWITTLPNLHSLAIGQNHFTTGDSPPPFTFNIDPLVDGTVNTTALPSVNPADVVAPSSTFLESFTRLPKLRQLKLDSLGISGTLPLSWQQMMVNLTKLDLSNNSMQGQIPGFINGFTELKTLLLDRNEFGGPIPTFEALRSLSSKF